MRELKPKVNTFEYIYIFFDWMPFSGHRAKDLSQIHLASTTSSKAQQFLIEIV